MADPTAERESVVETLLEKIDDKFHGENSSSSDSDTDVKSTSSSAVKKKIYRLFGREEPLHKVLGGGKSADIFLWRQKKISAGVLGAGTTIWVLFELCDYHLVTLVCHILMLAYTALFLWSFACKFINKASPPIPDFELPEDMVIDAAKAIRTEINQALDVIRWIATVKDWKKFLIIVTSLWIFSVIGGNCDFLTLFYISFVLLHTVPVIYEKYEDQIDYFGEIAEAAMKKQVDEINTKYLSKIPIKQSKGKKIA